MLSNPIKIRGSPRYRCTSAQFFSFFDCSRSNPRHFSPSRLSRFGTSLQRLFRRRRLISAFLYPCELMQLEVLPVGVAISGDCDLAYPVTMQLFSLQPHFLPLSANLCFSSQHTRRKGARNRVAVRQYLRWQRLPTFGIKTFKHVRGKSFRAYRTLSRSKFQAR